MQKPVYKISRKNADYSKTFCTFVILMPFTPEQIAQIRQKEAMTPDALKRNPFNDYTEGYFHVTLNTRGEAPVLGYITGTPTPLCILTEVGERVKESWNACQSIYPYVETIGFQIMPEHVHGLIHLKHGNTKHLGQIIRGFMIGCSHGYWDTLGIPWREMTYQKGVRTPQYNDRDHTRSFRGPSLFVRGYNDVEAITAEEVQTKIEYIRTNVERRIIKGENPRLFRVHRNMKSANWTPERIMRGLCTDRFIAADRNRQEEAWRQLTLNFENGRPVLDLVGNMELLKRKLFPLICHRADAPFFEQQKAAVLKVAREQGAVIVTACVSPNERSIVKLLQQELLPVIEVMDNGFSEKYKPTGKSFYAMAESRRLEITPWKYEYRRRDMQEHSSITREMCMVMNGVVRLITQKNDDWWKMM